MTGPVALALLIGFAVGALGQRTHFCTMGALTDLFLFGSARRLKGFVLAAALAMIAVQVLRAAGVPLGDSAPPPAGGWLGAAIGGGLFGFGMVLAGGCWSRNLVRLGTGSLKALVVVLLGAVTAAAFQVGVLSDITRLLGLLLPASDGPAVTAGLGVLIAIPIGLGALAWCLTDRGFRTVGRDLAVGVTLAVLATCGWLVALHEPALPGLNFAVTVADATGLLIAGQEPASQVGTALVIGTVAGAFVFAWLGRGLRLETFTARDDMVRHVVGAVLLGAGGALAAGCTIGHGIGGLAALLPTAPLALAGMVGGARWALRYLETGHLWPARTTR
jgi:uncharacterized membrane protein YedE/YeeE